MFSRFRMALGLAFLFALTLTLPASAGGWAVITLDELPAQPLAGEPLHIGFTVLQHGKTPMTDLRPTVTAKLSANDKMVVLAKPEGKPGHYAAMVTFPKEGAWEWSIQAFTMDQAMPTLRVAPSSAASGPKSTTPFPPSGFLRALGVGFGLIGLALAYRRKSRYAMASAALCLLILLAALTISAGGTSGVAAQGGAPADTSQVELGRQLFLAKGCITCHTNSKAADKSEYWTIDAGAPDLSKFSASPEVLRLRFKDPALVKSDTQMPDLNLSEAEAEALIAFINSN